MNKSHGPAFRAAKLDLAKCPTCRGKAVIRGVFHDLACVQCNASGWVAADGEALPLEELVTQLSLHLQVAKRHINELKHPRAIGPEAIYQEGNRRGPGGSNRTLD